MRTRARAHARPVCIGQRMRELAHSSACIAASRHPMRRGDVQLPHGSRSFLSTPRKPRLGLASGHSGTRHCGHPCTSRVWSSPACKEVHPGAEGSFLFSGYHNATTLVVHARVAHLPQHLAQKLCTFSHTMRGVRSSVVSAAKSCMHNWQRYSSFSHVSSVRIARGTPARLVFIPHRQRLARPHRPRAARCRRLKSPHSKLERGVQS